jgi:type IV pilus assembly protein PilA
MTPMTPPGAPRNSKMTMLIVVLVLGGLSVVCCIGTLAAIAIPNFIKFGAKSKQSEAKTNLKAIYIAERAFFAEKDTFSESFSEVGFLPERGNRYRYLIAVGGNALTPGSPGTAPYGDIEADPKMKPDNAALLRGIPAGLRAEVGMRGECPADCGITAVAVGNIDGDAAVDVWSVSTDKRTIDGEVVAAGVPHHDVDDLEN